MLLELWDYFTTPASKEAKREGFLYHSVALTHRARRCVKAWGAHLQNCHAMVNQACENKSGHVAVLGSGLMLETPIEDLCARFEKVTLIDVVHPKSMRNLVQGFPSVKLIEMNLLRERPKEKFDFVISANLLSQLPLVQIEKLEKIGYSQELILQMMSEIQMEHLEVVNQCAPSGLLFSDFQIEVVDSNNKVIEQEATIAENLDLTWQQLWTWDIAPIPEFSRTRALRLQMGGLQY